MEPGLVFCSFLVSVAYVTADGTAMAADGDYLAGSGALTFAAGETIKTVTVWVYGEVAPESDEHFFFDLSSPSSNALVADGRAVGLILDDDGGTNGPPACTFAVIPMAAETTEAALTPN